MIIWVVKYIPYILLLLAGLSLLGKLYSARNKVSAVPFPTAVKSLFGKRLLICIALSGLFFIANAAIKYCYNSMYPSLYISLN